MFLLEVKEAKPIALQFKELVNTYTNINHFKNVMHDLNLLLYNSEREIDTYISQIKLKKAKFKDSSSVYDKSMKLYEFSSRK